MFSKFSQDYWEFLGMKHQYKIWKMIRPEILRSCDHTNPSKACECILTRWWFYLALGRLHFLIYYLFSYSVMLRNLGTDYFVHSIHFTLCGDKCLAMSYIAMHWFSILKIKNLKKYEMISLLNRMNSKYIFSLHLDLLYHVTALTSS